MLNKYQWHCFWIGCAVIAITLCVQLWRLSPLYRNHDVRNRTRVLIQATAAREGWLLSGLSITDVSEEHLRLAYRSHMRGTDTVTCYTLSITSGALSGCSE